jgi:hypothetical protein
VGCELAFWVARGRWRHSIAIFTLAFSVSVSLPISFLPSVDVLVEKTGLGWVLWGWILGLGKGQQKLGETRMKERQE